MGKLKKILSITILLSALISIPAFSLDDISNIPINVDINSDIEINKISKEEFNNNLIGENINLIEESTISKSEEDIVLKINELNYYKPISLISLGESLYQIELADLLFDYGEVRLHIVGDGEDIPFSKIVQIDEEIIFNLKSNDYNCEILVTDKIADRRITFIGKIVDDQYELKWIDESTYTNNSLIDNITLQASTRESESNDTMILADTIVDSDDMYGTMEVDREDYYKITFPEAGKANFWLGQIPSSKNHNLYIYKSTSLIGSDTRTGLTQKLIQKDVVSGTTYYIRVSYPSGTLPTGYDYRLRVKLYVDLTWPISSSTIPINTCFGDDCSRYSGWHNGIDLSTPMNTLVNAAGKGLVTWSGRAPDSSTLATYGKYIDIVHTYENPLSISADDKYIKTRYAHLESADKSSGSTVYSGTTIGKSGDSGYEKDEITGEIDYNPYSPHLHFEVQTGASKTGSTWTRVHPLKYYLGKKCTCGISFNSALNDISNFANIRSIGIAINGEYFIDVESILSMSSEQLKRFGISDDKISEFNVLMKSDEKIYKMYNDKLEMLIN